MKKISINLQGCYLLLVLATLMQPVQAERYRLEDKPADLEKFQKTLSVQGVKLSDLLERVDKVEAWRSRLDQAQVAVNLENEQMQADRKRVELNEISSDDFQKKWNLSGRWLRYERELDEFKQDVVRFNQYLKVYNELAQEMMPLIQKRSPEEVKALLASMQQLLAALDDALSRKDTNAAEQLVLKSGLGKEFGYIR